MAQKLVLKLKQAGVVTEYSPQTEAEYVTYSKNGTSTTVAAELAALAAECADLPTTANVTSLIDDRINAVINGAPAAYDTFKEISDWIATHTSEYEALEALANSKVDKVDGKGLSTNDLTNELKSTYDTAATTVAAKEASWDGKAVIKVSSSEPADLADGEFWFQTV